MYLDSNILLIISYILKHKAVYIYTIKHKCIYSISWVGLVNRSEAMVTIRFLDTANRLTAHFTQYK